MAFFLKEIDNARIVLMCFLLIVMPLVLSSPTLTDSEESNCTCEYYPELDSVGPYCSKWIHEYPPFCYLAGGSSGNLCPGSNQVGNRSIYLTTDAGVCNGSSNYIDENCRCGYYAEYYTIGPYCSKWIETDPPFCILAGGSKGKFCPGAVPVTGNNSLYWSDDDEVCSRSTRPNSIQWTLSVREPLTVVEIVELCMYSLCILIGTFGNAFVVQYFAFKDPSDHPGSRYVIVLAVIDFVSSIWIPVFLDMVEILYDNSVSYTWPFGEIACRITIFYPLLFYSTSWLLLAISLETARAIYRPFAAKLHKRFIILTSILILTCSFVLELKRGLSVRYVSNIHVYVSGTDYEYSDCFYGIDPKDNLVITIISNTLGIWLPMFMIAAVYILIYIRLKKQAKLRRNNSSQNSYRQMRGISKTFTIILITYYVCYLPFTIQYTITTYFLASKREIDLKAYSMIHNFALPFTNFLMFSNNCLNPLIYGRIHLKIYSGIKISIITFRKKFFSQMALNCESPQTNAFLNLGIANEADEHKNHIDQGHDNLAKYLEPGKDNTQLAFGIAKGEFEVRSAINRNSYYSKEQIDQSNVEETAF